MRDPRSEELDADGHSAQKETSTMTTIKESIAELQGLAHDLNSETEGLNETIQSVEQQLAASKIGVSAWLSNVWLGAPESHSTDGGGVHGWSPERAYRLGFTKIGDAWCIAVQRVPAPQTMDDPMPLTKAPRIIRVEAAPHLAALVHALSEKARDYIGGIQRAREYANK
jgi:hypothetical protein